MNLNLPLHPSKVHPLTGQPLRAVGVLPSGRMVWPILGAAPDPPADPPTDPPAPPPTDPPTPPAPPAPPAPTQLPPSDPDYFPAGTAVKDMPVEQQAAYWKWNSQKHEARATEWWKTVGGGKKTAAEVAADLEASRTASLTDQQKAIEEAEKRGEEKATGAMSEKMATLALETAMAHVPLAERADLFADVNLARVIRADGSIDTDKVAAIVSRIAPANGNPPHDPDFGGGRRGPGGPASGVGAGRSRFQERHGKKTS